MTKNKSTKMRSAADIESSVAKVKWKLKRNGASVIEEKHRLRGSELTLARRVALDSNLLTTSRLPRPVATVNDVMSRSSRPSTADEKPKSGIKDFHRIYSELVRKNQLSVPMAIDLLAAPKIKVTLNESDELKLKKNSAKLDEYMAKRKCDKVEKMRIRIAKLSKPPMVIPRAGRRSVLKKSDPFSFVKLFNPCLKNASRRGKRYMYNAIESLASMRELMYGKFKIRLARTENGSYSIVPEVSPNVIVVAQDDPGRKRRASEDSSASSITIMKIAKVGSGSEVLSVGSNSPPPAVIPEKPKKKTVAFEDSVKKTSSDDIVPNTGTVDPSSIPEKPKKKTVVFEDSVKNTTSSGDRIMEEDIFANIRLPPPLPKKKDLRGFSVFPARMKHIDAHANPPSSSLEKRIDMEKVKKKLLEENKRDTEKAKKKKEEGRKNSDDRDKSNLERNRHSSDNEKMRSTEEEPRKKEDGDRRQKEPIDQLRQFLVEGMGNDGSAQRRQSEEEMRERFREKQEARKRAEEERSRLVAELGVRKRIEEEKKKIREEKERMKEEREKERLVEEEERKRILKEREREQMEKIRQEEEERRRILKEKEKERMRREAEAKRMEEEEDRKKREEELERDKALMKETWDAIKKQEQVMARIAGQKEEEEKSRKEEQKRIIEQKKTERMLERAVAHLDRIPVRKTIKVEPVDDYEEACAAAPTCSENGGQGEGDVAVPQTPTYKPREYRAPSPVRDDEIIFLGEYTFDVGLSDSDSEDDMLEVVDDTGDMQDETNLCMPKHSTDNYSPTKWKLIRVKRRLMTTREREAMFKKHFDLSFEEPTRLKNISSPRTCTEDGLKFLPKQDSLEELDVLTEQLIKVIDDNLVPYNDVEGHLNERVLGMSTNEPLAEDYSTTSLEDLSKAMEYPFDPYQGVYWPVLLPADSENSRMVSPESHIRRMTSCMTYSSYYESFLTLTAEKDFSDIEKEFLQNFEFAENENYFDVDVPGRFSDRKPFNLCDFQQDIADGAEKNRKEVEEEFEFDRLLNSQIETAENEKDVLKIRECHSQLLQNHVEHNRVDVYCRKLPEDNIESPWHPGLRRNNIPVNWTKLPESHYMSLEVRTRVLSDMFREYGESYLSMLFRDLTENVIKDQIETNDPNFLAWQLTPMLASIHYQLNYGWPSALDKKEHGVLERRLTKYKNLIKSNTFTLDQARRLCSVQDFDMPMWTVCFDQLSSSYRQIPPLADWISNYHDLIDSTIRAQNEVERESTPPVDGASSIANRRQSNPN